MLLIAVVILILMTGNLKAMELLEGESTLQQIWDPVDIEMNIDELQGEVDNLRKEEALERLKEILGIRGKFKKNGYKDVPPQFMMELYNTITDSDGNTRGKNPYDAKVVRSFTEKGSSSLHYYIFNVSGLEQNESVLEAELHLYRKRSSPKSMPPSVLSSPYYLIKVYQVLQDKSLEEPDLHRLLNVHYVGAYASGWQIFNVKQAVLSWLSGTPNLGLLVSATTIFGDLVSVDFSLRDSLPHDKQPILVLFNDDGTRIQSKQVNEEVEDNDELRENMKLEDDETFLENRMMANDRARSKRYTSVQRGEPEEAPAYIPGNRSENFHREKKSRAQVNVNSSRQMHGFVSRQRSLEHMLTSMDIYQRAMFREKLNQQKEGINKVGELQKRPRIRRDALSATIATVATPAEECRKPQPEPCAKRELYVNFRDIGLSTIIAPEGYAAYQCRGHCESPLSQEQKPTNHATIQGIIHKMNLASSQDVETPCCVPVNLSSISILYHDEERDGVVLKSYTDMAVVSCGCR